MIMQRGFRRVLAMPQVYPNLIQRVLAEASEEN
jgi:hypothetical protein